MTKNPLLNAISASLYISVIASVLNYGSKHPNDVDSVIIPIAMLSLFVLSAATMGCIFFLEPIRQYLDGKKESAVQLLLKTLAYFGIITFILFSILFIRTS